MIEFEEVIEHGVVTHYTQILVLENENGEGAATSKQLCPFTPRLKGWNNAPNNYPDTFQQKFGYH